MRFTMAQPEVSCHPETLLEGARTVVSAALCYYVPGPARGAGEGRLPRYAWRDHYALLRERLDLLGRRLGGAYRVLVDANQHVDRAGAERSGVGFIGKNTMLITRTHGSWVVLGTLVSDVEIEPTPPLDAGCGSCTLCIDACPTGALSDDEPGVLDATRCLSYWTQTAGEMPDDVMDALDDRVYGCDICQDVCPWNRGVEKRRADEPLPEDATPMVSLADWLGRRRRRARRRPRAALRAEERSSVAQAERAGGARQRRLGELGSRARTSTTPTPRSEQRRSACSARVARSVVRGSGARLKPHRIRPGMSSEGLELVAHELRSPVAALAALAGAAAGLPAAERSRALALGDCGRAGHRADPHRRRARLSASRARSTSPRSSASSAADGVDVSVAGRPIVEGDPTRLRQVLANLVANGLRHGSSVTIGVDEHDGVVVVDVVDDGPGVDPTVDVFARGVSGAGSSGLGLWVARTIAEAHGGSLELAAEPGPGARFRLSLPSASAAG